MYLRASAFQTSLNPRTRPTRKAHHGNCALNPPLEAGPGIPSGPNHRTHPASNERCPNNPVPYSAGAGAKAPRGVTRSTRTEASRHATPLARNAIR